MPLRLARSRRPRAEVVRDGEGNKGAAVAGGCRGVHQQEVWLPEHPGPGQGIAGRAVRPPREGSCEELTAHWQTLNGTAAGRIKKGRPVAPGAAEAGLPPHVRRVTQHSTWACPGRAENVCGSFPSEPGINLGLFTRCLSESRLLEWTQNFKIPCHSCPVSCLCTCLSQQADPSWVTRHSLLRITWHRLNNPHECLFWPTVS